MFMLSIYAKHTKRNLTIFYQPNHPGGVKLNILFFTVIMAHFKKEQILEQYDYNFTNGEFTIGINYNEDYNYDDTPKYVVFHGKRYVTDYDGFNVPIHERLVEFVRKRQVKWRKGVPVRNLVDKEFWREVRRVVKSMQ